MLPKPPKLRGDWLALASPSCSTRSKPGWRGVVELKQGKPPKSTRLNCTACRLVRSWYAGSSVK
jgi:hypothetical protein